MAEGARVMLHTPVGMVRDIPRAFFSPENVFWTPEDDEIIKMAFIAEGQVRNRGIIKVGRDLLDHQVQPSAQYFHCNP